MPLDIFMQLESPFHCDKIILFKLACFDNWMAEGNRTQARKRVRMGTLEFTEHFVHKQCMKSLICGQKIKSPCSVILMTEEQCTLGLDHKKDEPVISCQFTKILQACRDYFGLLLPSSAL